MLQAHDALILFAHGSRRPEANQQVEDVAQAAAEQAGFDRWRAAFLEQSRPDLQTAVNQLAAEGARRIIVVPYFLVMGVHLRQDFPGLLAAAAKQTSGVKVLAGEALGGHPGLARIVTERALAVTDP